MKNYVLGFLFDRERKHFVLTIKARPKWQNGLFNGVGGHIEGRETPSEAMMREFMEETQVCVSDWRQFCTMSGTGDDGEPWRVYCFESTHDNIHSCTIYETDEPRFVSQVETLAWEQKLIPNLRWLVPLALDGSFASVEAP